MLPSLALALAEDASASLSPGDPSSRVAAEYHTLMLDLQGESGTGFRGLRGS